MKFRYRQYSLDGKRQTTVSFFVVLKGLWRFFIHSLFSFSRLQIQEEGKEYIGTGRVYEKSPGLRISSGLYITKSGCRLRYRK